MPKRNDTYIGTSGHSQRLSARGAGDGYTNGASYLHQCLRENLEHVTGGDNMGV